MVDKEQESPDSKQDEESSEKSSEETKQRSQKVEITPELEKEIKRRVSDILAQKGDKAKTLEERVAAVEADNQKLRDKVLSDAAAKHGLALDKVKAAGIDTPEKIESLASLFGRSAEQPKIVSLETHKPDGGETSGGLSGKKPSLEELQSSDPFDTEKKVKSGEWVL